MEVIRHYDTVQWTAQTFPKNLTFDMRCDAELAAIMSLDNSGDPFALDVTSPEVRRLEGDGIIIRQGKASWGENRYHFILNRQSSLFDSLAA